jgi:hypothetical protein
MELAEINFAIDIMWYAQEHHLPTANGYSGFSPPNDKLSPGDGKASLIEWHKINGKEPAASEICIIETG